MNIELTSSTRNLKANKAALLAKLGEIENAAAQRGDLVVETSPDEIDMIRMALDRDVIVQHLNHKDRVLSDVRAALEGLERGDYGICADCDEAIATSRLNALPWAQRCVRCQDARERRGNENAQTTYLQAA